MKTPAAEMSTIGLSAFMINDMSEKTENESKYNPHLHPVTKHQHVCINTER